MFTNLKFDASGGLSIVVAIGLALAVLWILAFAKLMELDDHALPGRYARFGWVAAFLVVSMLAPLAFLLWNARRPIGATAADPARSRRRRRFRDRGGRAPVAGAEPGPAPADAGGPPLPPDGA